MFTVYYNYMSGEFSDNVDTTDIQAVQLDKEKEKKIDLKD